MDDFGIIMRALENVRDRQAATDALRRIKARHCSVARLRVTLKDALLGIAHMDVYTRDGEKPAHEVMRGIALAALKEIER